MNKDLLLNYIDFYSDEELNNYDIIKLNNSLYFIQKGNIEKITTELLKVILEIDKNSENGSLYFLEVEDGILLIED